ncbi:hypothetical protein [Streptomyces sp900116325]|uniref:Uncharacterized protein n=1 Tax=Streptomyces sp. 900116325 TaxID=3154295 RepID=A0ABV2UGS5_9ACTN
MAPSIPFEAGLGVSLLPRLAAEQSSADVQLHPRHPEPEQAAAGHDLLGDLPGEVARVALDQAPPSGFGGAGPASARGR